MKVIENYKAWDIEESIAYYESLRNRPEEVYESERVLFFPLLGKVDTVLDMGCAAGGFYNIIRTLNPKIKYTGLDVSEKMLGTAKRLFPAGDFRLTSGRSLDFPDNSFDMAMSLGVIHHIPGYKEIVKECFRVCRRYCLLDLPRLLSRRHTFDMRESYMTLKDRFHSKKNIDGSSTKVPYVLADAAEVFDFLSGDLKPKRILAKGYFGRTDKSATIPSEEVCFTVVCLEKTGTGTGEIIADLPKSMLAWLKDNKITAKEPFEWLLK